MSIVLLCALVIVAEGNRYVAPSVNALFVETFQGETFHPSISWHPSKNEKYSGRFVVDEPPSHIFQLFAGDKGLIAKESHRYYGLSRKLPEPIDPKAGKTFVIQYEFRPTETWDCAGGYLKFFASKEFDPEKFSGDDKYNIMFGPDRCGESAKIHFIVQTPDLKSGKLVEHHLKSPPEPKLDSHTHLYQLVLDIEKQSFDIYMDAVNVRNGSLTKEFEPPFEPPREISDPTDRQPDSWVTQEFIPDANAAKPADWDENTPEFIDNMAAQKPADWDESAPEYIKDPSAVKPHDWSDEDDGAWMHPMIPNPVCSLSGCGKWMRPRMRNPAFKGKWVRPIIANPGYRGKWQPRLVPNPNYYPNPNPIQAILPITAIGIEWWTTFKNPTIDNIVIGRSKRSLDAFAELTSLAKAKAEMDNYVKSLSAPPPPSKELQPWKFVAVGGVVLGVVLLGLVWKVCCSSASPADKPKRE